MKWKWMTLRRVARYSKCESDINFAEIRTESDMEMKQIPPIDTKMPKYEIYSLIWAGSLTPRKEHSLGSVAAYPFPL